MPDVAAGQIARRDIQGFHRSTVRPLEEFLDALLEREIPDSPDARFIFANSRFVENSFRNAISRVEGMSCCADKARTVVRKLLEFHLTGTEVSYDRTQQYTFHLPTTVFTTHGEAVRFLTALRHVHAGNPVPLVEALAAIGGPGRTGKAALPGAACAPPPGSPAGSLHFVPTRITGLGLEVAGATTWRDPASRHGGCRSRAGGWGSPLRALARTGGRIPAPSRPGKPTVPAEGMAHDETQIKDALRHAEWFLSTYPTARIVPMGMSLFPCRRTVRDPSTGSGHADRVLGSGENEVRAWADAYSAFRGGERGARRRTSGMHGALKMGYSKTKPGPHGRACSLEAVTRDREGRHDAGEPRT